MYQKFEEFYNLFPESFLNFFQFILCLLCFEHSEARRQSEAAMDWKKVKENETDFSEKWKGVKYTDRKRVIFLDFSWTGKKSKKM